MSKPNKVWVVEIDMGRAAVRPRWEPTVDCALTKRGADRKHPYWIQQGFPARSAKYVSTMED